MSTTTPLGASRSLTIITGRSGASAIIWRNTVWSVERFTWVSLIWIVPWRVTPIKMLSFASSFAELAFGLVTSTPVSRVNVDVTIKKMSRMNTMSSIGETSIPPASRVLLRIKLIFPPPQVCPLRRGRPSRHPYFQKRKIQTSTPRSRLRLRLFPHSRRGSCKQASAGTPPGAPPAS